VGVETAERPGQLAVSSSKGLPAGGITPRVDVYSHPPIALYGSGLETSFAQKV
jgi:hypothetical protein